MRSVIVKARVAVLAGAAVTATGIGVMVAQAGSGAVRTEAAHAAPAAEGVARASAAHAAHSRLLAARRCGTRRLGLRFRGLSAGAGQRSLTLVLINQSRSTCVVRGYPGLQFYGAFGHGLPTHESRVPGAQPSVVLRPGNMARSCLNWAAISPPFIHPNVIAVTPPANHSALIVVWRWGQVYRGSVNASALRGGSICP